MLAGKPAPAPVGAPYVRGSLLQRRRHTEWACRSVYQGSRQINDVVYEVSWKLASTRRLKCTECAREMAADWALQAPYVGGGRGNLLHDGLHFGRGCRPATLPRLLVSVAWTFNKDMGRWHATQSVRLLYFKNLFVGAHPRGHSSLVVWRVCLGRLGHSKDIPGV